MTHSLELIVLWSTKVGDKSLVLHTLSREWGRRSFIVTVSKSSGTSLFQPLSIINAEVNENPKSDLWRLRAASASAALSGLRGDVAKNATAMFISEMLFRTLRDGNAAVEMYEWCRRSILTLDALETSFANYHLRFLLELASQMGFTPSTEALAPFAGNHLRLFSDLLKCNLTDFLLYPLSGELRNEMAGIIIRYIEYHCESRIVIRSLPVLRELFR